MWASSLNQRYSTLIVEFSDTIQMINMKKEDLILKEIKELKEMLKKLLIEEEAFEEPKPVKMINIDAFVPDEYVNATDKIVKEIKELVEEVKVEEKHEVVEEVKEEPKVAPVKLAPTKPQKKVYRINPYKSVYGGNNGSKKVYRIK